VQEQQVFLRKILSGFVFLACCVAFCSICAAAPLMVEKNLFANDRKPPPPESDTSSKAAKAGMPVGNIQLDGVIIKDNLKRAILRMKNMPSGPPAKKGEVASPFVTVREGQMVSDYRVTKIERKSISLEKEGQTYTIGLIAENKVSPAPSPIPAPAPAPAPVPAQQEGVQPQPAAQQPVPQQAPVQGQPIPNRRGIAGNRSIPPNINMPVPDQGEIQDPNQPGEPVEEGQ
jgi:hypothetical protein